MKTTEPVAIHRKDYTPPPYFIDTVDLVFELAAADTTVTATTRMARNPAGPGGAGLYLDGQHMTLLEVAIDGRVLDGADYTVDDEGLRIHEVPETFSLAIKTQLDPDANKALEGLYRSSGNYCTQCEAEGFRRITYFQDRPDVMARYRTTIIGDKSENPVMLSNGNLVVERDLGDGRHMVIWEDPFPKPSYLFALVAGDLQMKADTFTTMSGRKVALEVYVEAGNLDKVDHCIASLQRSMKWDEEVYGREYDLDVYMIVAVGDFNMGAMENKGLNVFNTQYVLARQDTATDNDFKNIEGVVGHEYFHNWSGNRVTCRDWFQLTLKEGFTVFRDQEFSSDMTSRAVKRIEDVRRLRAGQFPEDDGPNAHPIRPESFVEINNFYTATIYNKGAEIIRMMHTIVGADAWRKGTDLYFERFDGQAVTCDDFVDSIEEASGVDLAAFRLWYSQAGTPRVHAEGTFDAAAGTYALTLTQSTPDTPGQTDKEPVVIPVVMGLLGADGADLPLTLQGESTPGATTRTLMLTERTHTFVFTGLDAAPVPSLLRGFSAPVKLVMDTPAADLELRMAHDSDAFNQWEAAQALSRQALLALVKDVQDGTELVAPAGFVAAFGGALAREGADPALLAEALALPTEADLGDAMDVMDPDAIHIARQFLRRALGTAHQAAFAARYEALTDGGTFSLSAEAMGKRALRNVCLAYLSSVHGEGGALATAQLESASNMTDAIAALAVLSDMDDEVRAPALAAFFTKFEGEPLVINKWFMVQALSRRDNTVEAVRGLLSHSAFDLQNPNRARSLIGAFAMNQRHFHRADGAGYAFLAEQVAAIDAFNPQVASRVLRPLGRWKRVDAGRQVLMQNALRQVLARDGVSPDVFEVASKALADAPGGSGADAGETDADAEAALQALHGDQPTDRLLSEEAGSTLLTTLFEAAGYTIARNVMFEERGVSFEADGFDAEARVGFEFMTTSSEDHEDLNPDELVELELRMAAGDVYFFVVDETDVSGPEELTEKANAFLAMVKAARG